MLHSCRDEQYCFAILLISSLIFSPIKYAFSSLLSLALDIPYHLDSVFLWILFIVLYVIPAIPKIQWTRSMIIIPSIIMISLIIFVLQYPEHIKEGILAVYKILFRAYPYYIISCQIKDFKLVKKYLKKAGYIITMSCLLVIGVKLYLGTMDRYDMTLAYMIFPATIINFWFLMEKFTWFTALSFIVSLVEVIFMGTRGPLLCFGIFYVYMIFYASMHSTKNKIMLVLITVLGMTMLILTIFGSSVFQQVAEKTGLSLRVFTALTNGEFFKSGGRVQAYLNSLRLVMRTPLLGTGILTDRYLLAELSAGVSGQNFMGTYSHLLFIEIIVQFGIVIGTIMCAWLLNKIIKILLLNQGDFKDVAVLFMFISILPLMLSGSYIQEPTFYVFLGILNSKNFRNDYIIRGNK